jgi:hypothetical protein
MSWGEASSLKMLLYAWIWLIWWGIGGVKWEMCERGTDEGDIQASWWLWRSGGEVGVRKGRYVVVSTVVEGSLSYPNQV